MEVVKAQHHLELDPNATFAPTKMWLNKQKNANVTKRMVCA